MAFTLPDLPYAYDALEPVIDAQTMQLHHGKHHNTYVTKLNAAVEGKGLPDDLTTLLKQLDQVPEDIRGAVRNNGGGAWNHNLFWELMAPPGSGGEPGAELKAAIDSSFGSTDNCASEFKNAALTRFGSGWAWLCAMPGGKLSICSTANQDNPIMPIDGACGGTPILGIDVWEHAYYLKYQNRRPDYVDAWLSVVNWNKVNELYAAAQG